MALGGAQFARRACPAGPAPAASTRVRILTLSDGPRMATLMLPRQEADGHERLLMAELSQSRVHQKAGSGPQAQVGSMTANRVEVVRLSSATTGRSPRASSYGLGEQQSDRFAAPSLGPSLT